MNVNHQSLIYRQMLSELKEGLDDESWDIDEIKLANLKPSFKQFNNDPSDTELDFNDADFSFASLDTAFSVSNTLTNLPPSTFTHFKSYCTKEKCHDTFTLSPRSTPFPSFSPSISIACSLVVSESEDENYDDLEFPETLSKQSIEQTDTLGLVIPLNFTGQISSKSKLKHTSNYLKPTASTLSKVKKVVLKCAKNAPVFGDGSELEMMDELIVKPGSELRYSKIAKNAATKINEKGFSRSEDVLAKRISLSRSLVNTSRAKSSGILYNTNYRFIHINRYF